LRAAQANLKGALGRMVGELRSELTAVLAELEAAIDFPEEHLAVAAQELLAERARRAARSAVGLGAAWRTGRCLAHGLQVALVGPPNVGKSSLFNALVGRERAVVTEVPGTTRDFIEEQLEWEGIAVTLIDTAGEREASELVERRGVELGRQRAQSA